jgi:hypothetical protein
VLCQPTFTAQACFATLRGRLSEATLEDSGLGQAADLNILLLLLLLCHCTFTA